MIRDKLKAQYLERKKIMGIFKISFVGDENIYLGAAPDIETIQNRISFTLKHTNDNKNEIAYLYKKFGLAHMKFDILEAIEFEADNYIRRKILKEKLGQYLLALNAKEFRV
jgi:hypothetical protein